MAYPSKPSRAYSFTGFSSGQGDNSFPGPSVDSEIDNTNLTVASIITFLKTSLASDGTLKPGVVSAQSLSSALSLGIEAPTTWLTGTTYAAGNSVTNSNSLYVCTAAHTADVFATDLAGGYWQTIATFAPLTTVSDGAISEAKLADDAVATAKLQDEAVTAAKVADGTLTAAKAAVSFGTVPVGSIQDYAGVTEPSGWLFCYGQAVSRSTYSSLFTALTVAATGTRVLGSTTLTAVNTDLSNSGLVGAPIEGTGIPSGTTITAVTATTITMSQPAVASGTAQAFSVIPYGVGDGATTFNVPDARGRVVAGRDGMGGTAAGRMTASSVLATLLGAAGGAETHTLLSAEMPTHSHSVTDGGHTHAQAAHTHLLIAGVSTTANVSASNNVSYDRSAGGVSDYSLSGIVSTPDRGISGPANPSIGSATTGVTVGSAGSGGAHNNVQPVLVANKIIFAGVA